MRVGLSIPFIKDVLIPGFKPLDLLFRQTVLGLGGSIGLVPDIKKAVDHAINPVLVVLLVHKDQLVQMVSVVQPMQAGVAEVGFPEFVESSSDEARQCTDGVEGLAAAFSLDIIICDVHGGGRMKPLNPPVSRFHQSIRRLPERSAF